MTLDLCEIEGRHMSRCCSGTVTSGGWLERGVDQLLWNCWARAAGGWRLAMAAGRECRESRAGRDGARGGSTDRWRARAALSRRDGARRPTFAELFIAFKPLTYFAAAPPRKVTDSACSLASRRHCLFNRAAALIKVVDTLPLLCV